MIDRPPSGLSKDFESLAPSLTMSRSPSPRHEISYEAYTNHGYHASRQGIINIIHPTTNPLEKLDNHSSPNAAFDSAARFGSPRCTDSWALSVLEIIEDWIDTDGDQALPSSLFWLYGDAGVGKSALAQSLSESYDERGQLAATFFFSRDDLSRHNGEHLIPTLVSHLVHTFKEIVPFIENNIRNHRAIFTKGYKTQIRQLLIEPLLSLKSNGAHITHPRLVVIDGLDECHNPGAQCELLRVIAYAISQIPYPLRFFITSRPEVHITHFFDRDHSLQAIKFRQHNLFDVRKFLEKEFVEICQVHHLGQQLPHGWPGREATTSLVSRSSGHLIYASTVIRYIRSPKHRPDDRLEAVLHLQPREGNRAYDQLDALYGLIFQGVESPQLEKICLALGILYLHSTNFGQLFQVSGYAFIEKFLQMTAGDFDPILPLIAIGDNGRLRVIHLSLFGYLLDSTRSRHLPLDLARAHESIATFLFDRAMRWGDEDGLIYLQRFARHCRYGYLNDTLRNYLQSLEVPFHGPVTASPKVLPPWTSYYNLQLRSVMWHFLRILSREDFDSTGQVHGQYVAKWMDYLHSAVPLGIPPVGASSEVDDLKRQVDTVLKGWKPQNFNHKIHNDPRIDPVRRLSLIEREHDLFSAYTSSSCHNTVTCLVPSSLVLGDYFIHSYVLVDRNDRPPELSLRTYSRHANICFTREVDLRSRSDIQMLRDCLTCVEKYFRSDISQKNGIQPDEYLADWRIFYDSDIKDGETGVSS